MGSFLAQTSAQPKYRAVQDRDLSVADNTANDVTQAHHGFIPKLPFDAREFFRGDGEYAGVQRLSNPTLTTPTDLENGDFWVEASGVSPARVITLNVRDNGVTKTILTYTY